MAKKQKEPQVIRLLNLEDIERIKDEIAKFMQHGDDMYVDQDSVILEIYDDGSMKVCGEFVGNHSEEINI